MIYGKHKRIYLFNIVSQVWMDPSKVKKKEEGKIKAPNK